MIRDTAYGCTIVGSLRGSVLDASGHSCPVTGGGFYEEDFGSFQWNFTTGTVEYASILYGHDADQNVVTSCVTVAGTATPQ